jgi:tungstate transport system ATP-binding protein
MEQNRHPLIEVEGLVHYYNSAKVLDVPHLSFARGLIYAFLGPNGSGKTTLLNILGLLLRPTAGNVLYEKKELLGNPALMKDIRGRMTTVIQNPILFDMSVENNVAYGLRIRGASREERKRVVRECLAMVKLDGFQGRRARELSGGEAQRVAIARALAVKPQVLFLDEYTANVDEKSIVVLDEVVATVRQNSNTTVFLVTHDTRQAHRLADEVINLFAGKVVQSSMENLFKGTIARINGLSVLDTGKIKMEIISEQQGEAHAAINPRDIIVSHQPLSTSARNSFCGIIVEVLNEGAAIRLRVDAGEVFKVLMTKASFQEMKLDVGTQVYITFKSTAVEIL